MSYEQKRKDIQNHFTTNFTGVVADNIAFDNVEFTPPEDKSAWVRFSLQNTGSTYVSTGPGRKTRRSGIIFIQVFTKKADTTLTASQIVDNVVNVYETKLLGGIVFHSPNVNEVGVDGEWFQINISVPFYYDVITQYV